VDRHATAREIALLLGDTEAAGLPRLVFIDGPNGVRGADGATAFPSCLVLAATFDRSLARRYGESLADETIAAGANVLLGPGFDILRVPLAGRSAESFGEDPLVTGELGGSTVAGIQSRGVLAVLKHFVGNNFEWMRTGSGVPFHRGAAVDVRIDGRVLRELYAAPFRQAVMNYGARAIMASYNRIDGCYVAENAELLDLPRAEWGFDGITLPDFMLAVRAPKAALEAGLDVPGLDGPSGRTEEMIDELAPRQRAAMAERISRVAAGVRSAVPAEPARLGTESALRLAEEIAIRGAVLLRNHDDVLPVAADRRIALVAPADLAHLLVTGGSAAVALTADRLPDLGDELRSLGFAFEQVDPCAADVPQRLASADDTPSGSLTIAVAEHNREAAVLDVMTLSHYGEPGVAWSAHVDVDLVARSAGLHRLSVTFAGEVTLRLGDADAIRGFREASPMIAGPEYPLQAAVELGEGDTVRLQLEYRSGSALDVPPELFRAGFTVGWDAIGPSVANAVAVAARSDVAVVVVGRVVGEAMDADRLTLPEPQDRVVRAVNAVAPKTVVIVAGAGPVVMPWREEVDAILHVGNPGERGASALARILSGDSEPGGRLPFTLPRGEGSPPVPRPGPDLVVEYSEGFASGYRGYAPAEIAYPFGHGLGYGRVEWGSGSASVEGARVVVRGRLRNLDGRATRAVPQIYLSGPLSSAHRRLSAFDSVELAPREERDVELAIPVDDLRHYDAVEGTWAFDAGTWTVETGFSSLDIRAIGSVELS
jgi:beta-glucosidase